MTIRHLRIFVEVANSGKMSLAANRFFISQPTVSQTISELEKHYDVLLFERIAKRLYITDAGRTLLSYATKVLKEFDELEYCMMNTFHIQPIKIGATDTVGTCLISDIVTKLKKIYSEIEVSVFIGSTKEIEQKLMNMELDIALVEGQVKSFDLSSTPTMEDYLVLVCSNKNALCKKKNITVEDIKGENFILGEEGNEIRQLFLNFMKMKKIPVKINWVSNSTEAIKRGVLSNQGISVMSVRFIEEEIKNNSIKIIPVDGCSWSRNFFLVHNKNKYISAHMNSLIDIIHSYRSPEIFKTLI